MKPYIRVVQRPVRGDLGAPQSRVVKRVEIVDGDHTINLPCQDMRIEHPVGGVSYVTLSTPWFTEVIESDGTDEDVAEVGLVKPRSYP